MSTDTLNLTPALYQYYRQNAVRAHPVLEQLRHHTQSLSMAEMQISPEQGQLMGLLIELLGAKRTLEVGVFTGYSTLAVALALPEDGQVIACDINSEWTEVAKHFWEKAGVAKKIDLRLAPATLTLNTLLSEGQANTFDFAFIDADKANYPTYYEQTLNLIRPGGLIAIDNVLWHGKVADLTITDERTRMFRKLNQDIVQDKRVTMCMLPIGDGLTLARKR